MVIAVDGPAGAGKSSIAKIVALKLGLEYVDSGAIYRSISKKILDSVLKIDDYTAIENILREISLTINNKKVFVDGVDYSSFIRAKEVTEVVPVISANKAVRFFVNSFLNEYVGNNSVIMDGRDIGTEVFPDADYKFYLDASVDERAKRRFEEIGDNSQSLEEIKSSISRRDYNDMNRDIGPLKQADDAIYIDTTKLSIDEVVNKIIECIK